MKKYSILFFLVVLAGCSSQHLPDLNSEFAASPLLYLKSSEAVVKSLDAQLTISSRDYATYHIRKVVTVLSADGRSSGKLVLPYGGFQDIKSVKGEMYSKDGELLQTLNEKDGLDFSLTGSYTLYEDTRIKVFELYHSEYPYTIVYDYELEFTGLLNLPDFHPQNQNQYVEQASLEVRTPKDLELKYKPINVKTEEKKTVHGPDSVFTWKIKELTPLKKEPFGPSFIEVAPRILLAVKSFKMADTYGYLNSWNNFGKWYFSLSEGRGELPESTKQEIKNIFDNSSDRREGIKALYKYMQNKTRYVSIQLGIGGWQPFKAQYVEEKGYGDCKALTNYMQAILHYAGVKAYPVLIKNGLLEPDIITNFPSNQFNHVVLWVPEADTLWLESTSQSIPFNYLGFSNSNRHGLAVTPDSSFLIKTPDYNYNTNKLKNEIALNLDAKGNAVIEVESFYSGYYLDKLLRGLAQKTDLDREKWIHEELTLNSFSIDRSNFSDIDDRKKEPKIHLTISNPRYATKTGSRLFIPINKLNKWEYNFPAMESKRTDKVDLRFSFTEEDRSVITLPPNITIEAIPSSVDLSTDFSTYNLQIKKMEDNRIEITRVLKITQRRLAATQYEELRNFFTEVSNYDKKNIVLKAQ